MTRSSSTINNVIKQAILQHYAYWLMQYYNNKTYLNKICLTVPLNSLLMIISINLSNLIKYNNASNTVYLVNNIVLQI